MSLKLNLDGNLEIIDSNPLAVGSNNNNTAVVDQDPILMLKDADDDYSLYKTISTLLDDGEALVISDPPVIRFIQLKCDKEVMVTVTYTDSPGGSATFPVKDLLQLFGGEYTNLSIEAQENTTYVRVVTVGALS
jgi:hypothetical protein